MQKKHILLIDDEADFAETLSARLEMRGYIVSVAHDGKEALEKAKDKPDLILLDVILPPTTGYAICRTLRKDNKTKYIPIIMLTAKNCPYDRIEGLQVGADDYITKSFDVEELFARIEALFRRGNLLEKTEEDRAVLIEELKRIIRNELVEIVFQPIFYLEPRQLFAYEVLSRGPQNSSLKEPGRLFQCALDYGMLFDLEILCRKKAMAKFCDIDKKCLIFFNTSPYIIESDRFKDILALYTRPEQVVLEITERVEIKDFAIFCQTISSFKTTGFKISIDDVGSGYSSLGAIAKMDPDFVKIDMTIVRDIDTDPKKQDLVKAIMLLCERSRIIAIGEGIETEDELNTLINLGVEVGQGYFLGQPHSELL